ncbi:hypothetical protein EDB80DRAFT_90346 [Ilyonectria destructans]|nr:hypothetical protein EDB80DRAFT_90346 [Ilyonectria destructans]
MAGSLLRRLISSNRPKANSDCDGTDSCGDDDDRSAKKPSETKQRTQSWIPASKKKHSSTVPIDIRRVHSIHRVSSPLPHVTVGSHPYSSSYSSLPGLTAQEDVIVGTPPQHRRAASTLCLPNQGRINRHSLTPQRPPRPMERLLSSPDEEVLLSQTHLRPSLSLSVPGVEHPETRLHCHVSLDKESPTGSMIVDEILILETEEAFKAVGSALQDIRPTSQTYEQLPTSTRTSTHTSTLPLPLSLTYKHSQSMPLPLRYNKDLRSSPCHPSSPARKASVKKPKRKEATLKSSFSAPRQRRSLIHGSRWALSGNVTDILTGQRFKRIEADEMLTPERLELLKIRREKARLEKEEEEEKQLKARESIELTCSLSLDSPDTPVEPFHLQDLPSRIGAAGVAAMTTFAEPVPPSVLSDQDVTHEDFSIRIDTPENKGYLESPEENDTSLTTETPIPLPPPKNPARFGTPPHLRPLPPLPKTKTATRSKAPMKAPKRIRGQCEPNLKAEEKDGVLYLKSTPFTLTQPQFRHGSITLPKAESHQAVTMDDTLDWTAFQMAILCGAGDLFQDLTIEEDAKQVEDITTWFGSFGFETYGEMIREDVPALSFRTSSQSTISSTPSTIDMDMDLPIPVGSEYPSGFWNDPSSGQCASKEKFYSNSGLKRWMGEGRPKKYTSRSSMDSLPPSPMLPLVMSVGDISGDEAAEPVPMGYNLHHDLGDFLRWEAENVWASGFCDSP